MQTRGKFLDDMSQLMTNAMGVAQGARTEAETAFRALLRGHRMLGPGLGSPDFGKLPPDMV